MHKTVEGVLDSDGRLRLLEKVKLGSVQRVLVTFLEAESEEGEIRESALLSEAALATDWSRVEEDEAWQHLQ